jgi:hypothetical protein
MGKYIDDVKKSIINLVERMANRKRIRNRVGFCVYRDYTEASDRLQIFNFTDSHELFKSSLLNVLTKGGREEPEDVLGGLNAAMTKMTWRDGIRVIFHIGDAPPHGRLFSNLRDDYPDGDPTGLTAENVLEKMRSAETYYFFVKLTNKTDEMIRIFKTLIGDFPVIYLTKLTALLSGSEALVKEIFDTIMSR